MKNAECWSEGNKKQPPSCAQGSHSLRGRQLQPQLWGRGSTVCPSVPRLWLQSLDSCMELFEDGQVNSDRQLGDKGHNLSVLLQWGLRSPSSVPRLVSGVGSPAAVPGHEPESFRRRLLVWASDSAEKPRCFSALSLSSTQPCGSTLTEWGDSCCLFLSSCGLDPEQGAVTASEWRSRGGKGLGSWLED